MKNKFLLFIALAAMAVAASIATTYFLQKDRSISYVKADVVFNDFEMTKELKVKLDNTVNARQTILDSIMVIMRIASENGNKELLSRTEKEYYIKKEAFDGQNRELTQKYDEQVWLRINQYVKEFGEKKHYDYLLGANGSGSLMYSSEKNDVTKELLDYMNTSYKGSEK